MFLLYNFMTALQAKNEKSIFGESDFLHTVAGWYSLMKKKHLSELRRTTPDINCCYIMNPSYVNVICSLQHFSNVCGIKNKSKCQIWRPHFCAVAHSAHSLIRHRSCTFGMAVASVATAKVECYCIRSLACSYQRHESVCWFSIWQSQDDC